MVRNDYYSAPPLTPMEAFVSQYDFPNYEYYSVDYLNSEDVDYSVAKKQRID